MNWPYLAGFFDGEGCIHYSTRPYGRYVLVKVSQGWVNERSGVCGEVLDFLGSNGIRARLTCKSARERERFGKHEVIASSAEGCRLWLVGMLPFLIVKRNAAEGAIKHTLLLKRRTILAPLKETVHVCEAVL